MERPEMRWEDGRPTRERRDGEPAGDNETNHAQ